MTTGDELICRRALLRASAAGVAFSCVGRHPMAAQTVDARSSTSFEPSERRVVSWPSVRLLDGSQFDLSACRGDPLIVVFWSVYCSFCHRHNQHVARLYRETVSSGLWIVTAVRERDPDLVRRHVLTHSIPFPVTTDFSILSAAVGLKRRVVPLTVIADRQGLVSQTIPGEMAYDDVIALKRL